MSKFWKPGESGPGASLELQCRESKGDYTGFVHNENSSDAIQSQRQRLPISKYRSNLIYLVEKYQVVVLLGETGCGKSTQVPQYLMECGWATDGKIIGVTQPRRVAAVSVASRVAEEKSIILGDLVGYAIRFEDCWNPETTKVKFLTDGLLIREMMHDPLLTSYSIIMVDEAHERSINTDIVLGLLKKILKRRRDLHLIVASATLDAEFFKDFFNRNITSSKSLDTACIMHVEGREYPVSLNFSIDPQPDYIRATIETCMKIHIGQDPGDILAFLTGQEEVEDVASQLVEKAKALSRQDMKMHVVPLYGGLPSSKQMKAFEKTPFNHRKIVISTNIAEASVTIPGIVYVIDCGFVKLPVFNVESGVESLMVVPISKASAVQRAGRAGRVRAGRALRLYTEKSYEELFDETVPEMRRCDMSKVLLQLKALGISNVLRFDFLSAPPAQNMLFGIELLYALGAIDDCCNLVDPLGLKMAEFPLPPMFSKMLLTSDEFGCSEEAATIAACMQVQSVWNFSGKGKLHIERCKRNFGVAEGDLIMLLNIYQAFLQNKNSRWCKENCLNYRALCHVIQIREQLVKLMVRHSVKMHSCEENPEPVLRCITSGFFSNAAYLHSGGQYRTVRHNFPLSIHNSSVIGCLKIPPKWIIFNEVLETSSNNFMRDISVIDPIWLHQLAPHYYDYGTANEIKDKQSSFVS